ncbi:hypothetical protein X769_28545 [Mesorhizobium sp. LSJC268A00]|nr:hypothetical protein X769_28545 [Mesorhizobium sp. LSJC268A00]
MAELAETLQERSESAPTLKNADIAAAARSLRAVERARERLRYRRATPPAGARWFVLLPERLQHVSMLLHGRSACHAMSRR